MTAPNQPPEAEIFSSDAPPDPKRPSKRVILRAGLITLVVLAIAAWIISGALIAQERQRRQAVLEQELASVAHGRAEVLVAWLNDTAALSGRIVDSELFRLFATEIDLSGIDIAQIVDAQTLTGDGASDAGGSDLPLLDQVPFMERVLSDFVIGADFLSGYLFARSGVAYVTSGGAAPASPAQAALATGVFETNARSYGPARMTSAGLAIDMALPVHEAQAEPGSGTVVGVMLFAVPVGAALADLLAPRPGAQYGESLHLLQQSGDALFAIRPGESPPLVPLEQAVLTLDESGIPFARRRALNSANPAYSSAVAIPATAWWLLPEMDAGLAEAELERFTLAARLVSALVLAAAALAFLAFWWWLGGIYSRAMAQQYRLLGNRISAQKQLLDRINSRVADYIGVKAADGSYLFANAAFADAVGRPAEQIVGLDDSALFGQGTARRLALSDARVLQTAKPEITEERVYLQSDLRYLQLSKSPFTDEAGKVTGVVAVARDVTELVEAREKQDKAVRQTIAALVLAVELRDPYLSGHSQRVAELASEVARLCGASTEDIATLETGASLSQIGKLFVPRALLTKPDRLSEAERAEVRAHIGHAESVLRGIDFGLPVLTTIRQMQERIDGQGYPRGLRGDEITLTAQVLGLCDWFCARVAPRAHRPSIAPEAALEILEDNPHRYAPDLVAKLRQAVTSVSGEKLVASVGAR